jgi:hypothetical protein
MKSNDIKNIISQTMDESNTDNKGSAEINKLGDAVENFGDDEEVTEKQVAEQLKDCLKHLEEIKESLPEIIQKVKKGISSLK